MGICIVTVIDGVDFFILVALASIGIFDDPVVGFVVVYFLIIGTLFALAIGFSVFLAITSHIFVFVLILILIFVLIKFRLFALRV